MVIVKFLLPRKLKLKLKMKNNEMKKIPNKPNFVRSTTKTEQATAP